MALLSRRGVTILRKSGHFRSSAFPPGSGPDFVNGVLLCDPGGERPAGIMAAMHEIESTLGRVRRARWAARTLDLDLVDYAGMILPDRAEQTRWRRLPPQDQQRETPGQLLLPHPRVQDRAFVLVPLREVAPDWRHPVTGCGVDEMIAALDPADVADVTPLAGSAPY